MPQQPLPQPFGPFLLREQLGATSTAEAFLATRESPGAVQRPVVVHRFLPPHGQDRRFGALLAAELRAVSELAHPGIVRLHDAGAIDDCWFLVTDYVEGVDLASWLPRLAAERRPLPIGLACFIAAELAAALAHAHAHAAPDGTPQGVVHGAVRPDRVLISKAGEVLLLDFGVAAALDRYQHTDDEDKAPRAPILETSADLAGVAAVLAAMLPADPAQVPASVREVLEHANRAAAFDRYENARALRKAVLAAAKAAGLEGDREALADFLYVPPTTELRALPRRAAVQVQVQVQDQVQVQVQGQVQVPVPAQMSPPDSSAPSGRGGPLAPAPVPVPVPAPAPVPEWAPDLSPAVPADLSSARPSQRLPVAANPLPRPRLTLPPEAPRPLPLTVHAPTPAPQVRSTAAPEDRQQPPRPKATFDATTRFVEAVREAPQPPQARTRHLDALPQPARPATPRPQPLPVPKDPDDAPASWGLVAATAAVWIGALVVGVYAMLLTLTK